MTSTDLSGSNDSLHIDRLGPYKIERELGRGGMGIVYQARQDGLDRRVALKVILPHLAVNPGLMARFKREYQTHAQLDHPNIVRFLDADEEAGFHYYAMEFLDAAPLDKIIRATDTTQEFRMAYRVAESMASALDYLHKKSIFHRDIKPGNVMIENRTGRVVLMDFGLVKAKDVTQLTRVGKTVGSPRYMAPEMLDGTPADGRTDIYQVGVTLYQVATGKLPFDGPDLTSLAAAILYGRLVPPREVCPIVPISLSNLILNCMARDPTERYQDAGEMLADVKRLRAGLAVRPLVPSLDDVASADTADTAATPALRTSGVASGMASVSASLKPVSTATVPVEASVSPPPLIPLLLFLLAASVVPFYLLWPSVEYHAEGLEVVPGVNAARLTWSGSPSYPSRVVVRPAGSDDPDLARIFVGEAPAEGSPHLLVLEPLDPEKTYEARIVFPDGSSSLPRSLPRAVGDRPRVERSLIYQAESVVLVLHATPPCRGSLRYREQDRWREVSLGEAFASEHRIELPLPPARSAWEDVSLALEAVGAREVIPLDAIRGPALRLEDFCRRVEALDMEPTLRRLGESLSEHPDADAGVLAMDLLGVPDVREVADSLAGGEQLAGAGPLEWRVYHALRKLAAVDAWFEGQQRPRLLHLEAATQGLVRLHRPTRRPPGGQRVMHLELPGPTSFVPFGGTERSRTILQIYAGSTKIEKFEEYRGEFTLAQAPPRQGRAALALQVRNLHPEYLFRVALNGHPGMDLFNTRDSFKGYFWAQIAGEEAEEATMAKIRESMQWLVLEFPAAMLEPGINRFMLQGRVHEGLAPNHFIDAYEMWVWPQAPSIPATPPPER